MKKFLLKMALAGLTAALLASCASTSDKDASQAYKGESAKQIYEKGRTALRDSNYSIAIKRFEALDVQYPFGSETEKAQLYIIYAYYMKDEYALAAAAADRFIRIHPANSHVDYAYYMRGLANYNKNIGLMERTFGADLATRDLAPMKKAFTDFQLLTKRFPNSTYTPSAHQYMVYLRNIFARHEFEVAQYYYKREAYVAAANRAGNVVAKYQGAPVVVNALVLMAKSYNKLGMTKAAQEALLVLKYNYPKMTVTL